MKTFPEIDTPEIFGLHPNADLTFRVKEVNALFSTLGNTQPKVSSAAQVPEIRSHRCFTSKLTGVDGFNALSGKNLVEIGFCFRQVQRLSAAVVGRG